MFKYIMALMVALPLFVKSVAQGSLPSLQQNYIYVEAGGAGLFASINYERQIARLPGLGLRMGVGFYAEKAFYVTVPVGINYLFPLKKNGSFIEAAATTSFARINGQMFGPSKSKKGNHFTNFIPALGYLRHTRNNLLWKAMFTPVINNNGMVPWVGLSLGRRF